MTDLVTIYAASVVVAAILLFKLLRPTLAESRNWLGVAVYGGITVAQLIVILMLLDD